MPVSQGHLRRAAGLVLASALLLLLAPRGAQAQGCVASRMDSPAIGSGVGRGTAGDGKWEFYTSIRHFRSDKHFVGSNHDEERDREHSQVINDTYVYEVGFRYLLGPRWSFSASLPYVNIDRSNPLRVGGVVVDRALTHSSGIGDLNFVARRWMLDPAKHHTGNLALGFGAKFPTGDKDQKDWRARMVAGVKVETYENVDQSIQPGDGGFGFIFEIQGYKSTKGGGATLYGQLSYLFNPEETDHVLTNRSAPEEKYMSIADQYLARVGCMFHGKSWGGWTAGGGLRVEGVPTYDVFGGSDWFRRPGHAMAIEPIMQWAGPRNAISLSIPVVVDANRYRSVPDKKRGTHGDAAFADWSVQFTYSHRFGGGHH